MNLIKDFFAALENRNLSQCEAVLAQLTSLSCQQPAYTPWCAYFDGILANERDHNWAKAERIFDHLLRADLDPPLRGRVLLALGRTCEYEGRWEEAICAYERALPIFAELGRPVDQAKAWKQMAISRRRGFTRGDFGPQALQKAITHCQRSLDLLEPIADPPGDVAWLKGSVWNTLGLIHRSLGQWDQALACYRQDLDICRSLGDRFGIGLSYGNLGEVYQKRGRDTWPQALDAYQKALSVIREFGNRYEEAEVLANLGFLYQEMGECGLALDHYGQAICLIESLRAGVSAKAARAGFFATVVDTYANTVLLCLEAGREEHAFDYVERARSRALLDVLITGSSDLSREMAATPMTLAEVQTALPAGALLIEYFTTGLVEARDDRAASDPSSYRHRFPPARTLIFAVTGDRLQVHDAELSPNDLLPRQLDSVVERHFLKPEIRRALYDKLIAPVEGLLRDRRRLYLVPHGPLHYIPFQALVAADGDPLLREEGPQLVYAPSATILFRHGRKKPARAPLPCLALGYNDPGAARLRFAEEEAHSVARLIGGRVMSGPSPKKAALYSQATNHQVLHFSCHGEFDPDAPLASGLHLAPGETLTALDVLEHLRLRCDLVTLSACESGLSRVRRGDELVGLTHAFMHAGTPMLISTLWRVDERSTLILMEKFYQRVQTGTDLAEALKQAQIYLKDLTRREALETWAHCLADEAPISSTPPNESRSDLFATDLVRQRANTYLKGLGTKDGVGRALGETDDERIFAAPYYWAPFVLVGERGSGGLEG
ncbi:MAG: CHAT domain-containing tetratricopeptide repeat protein [Chloroflexota bacterium]|nr:CHAT domain-containing tetratricopeptide repeat protein [Chloroflexota bacterium]